MQVKPFLLALLMGAAMTAAAFGQQQQIAAPPQPFVPFVVTESDYKTLTTYLNEAVPKKYADQIWLWADALEQRAQLAAAEAAKAREPKKDEQPK